MIAKDDLKAAVGAGILTEAQAASLASLADSRRGARENLEPGDEPFELFRGFNEIFIVIGLGILTAGWLAFVGVTTTSEITNPQAAALRYGSIGAVILWGLSEYFIRKRRMIAPAIALSILFAANAAFALAVYFAEPFMIAQENFESLPMPFAIATGIIAVYWWRFKVPIAMAMIAIGLFVVAILFAAQAQGSPQGISDLFLLSAGGPFAWITLVVGIAVFVVAMLFDMSDRHRVTRRCANGFWLHVVAAPALVNTVALTLLDRDSAAANLTLFALLLLFAAVAIIIDRRSFLIAAIGYIVVLATITSDAGGTALTILTLGAVLLALGAFWERIRAVLMRLVPARLADRLPPFTPSPFAKGR